jgi:hypothetical protein
MSDKTICNLPELIGGPFKQVIYLGCSVKDFKINVGWGGETSSCTVNLVRDTQKFYEEPAFGTQQNSYQANNSKTFVDIEPGTQHNGQIELNSDIKGSPAIKKKSDYLGKRCYNIYDPYSNTNYSNLTKKDPGFIAELPSRTEWSAQYDIIGIPTIFKWEDIFFGGIIQNWTKRDDQSYSVEINSFAKILKGVTLILKEYYGSISTIVNGYDVPFNWGFFPSEDYTTVWPDRGKGSTRWGNRPNIVNIYGYLESQGFGNSGYGKERGIPAKKVYQAVKEIFNPTNDAQLLFKIDNPFSPNQYVSTKQLLDRTEYQLKNASEIVYEDISLNRMGLLDGSGFKVDFSNVPEPPDGVYINSDTMDLISFIDFCCEGAGMDYIISFDGHIRINTIDRKEFRYRTDLSHYITSLASSDKVVSYNLGEEYSHNQTTKMAIGGRQKRLLQVNSFSVGTPYYKVYDPNSASFYNQGGSQENFRQPNFLNWAGDSSGAYGTVEADDFISAISYSWSPHSFNSTIDAVGSLRQTVKGSYFDYVDPGSSASLAINNISPFFGVGKNGTFRYPYWDSKTGQMLLKLNWTDIEPFLPGLYDNNYQSATLNAWVKTNIPGQTGFINYDPLEYGTGDFLITEYELRAAGAGFDQWWNYTQTRTQFGAPSDLARILYNYLSKNYGLAFAIAILYTDVAYDTSKIDYMAYFQIASATYGGRPLNLRPVTHEQYTAWSSGFSNVLRSIHGFIADLVNTHYGKTYAIRVPNIIRGYSDDGGKDNYEITDAAWESRGNMVDDTMLVGSAALSKLQEEDGRIGCLLGFDNFATSVPYGGPTVDMPQDTFGPLKYATQYMTAYRMGFIGGTTYWPLVHNFANDSSVMIPYGTFSYQNATIPSQLANNAQHFKLYTKASPLTLNPQNKNNPNVIYDGFLPKVILTPPGEISSISDNGITALFDEVYSLFKRGINRPATTDTIADQQFDRLPRDAKVSNNLQIYLKFMIWQKSRRGILEDLVDDHPYFVNRAPLPTFAAVPIESVYFRYGPWINGPYGIKEKIVPELVGDQASDVLNNIVGSTQAVIEDSLVPWEFGGEYAMTDAASTIVSLDNQYQTNIEVGSVTFAGLVIRGTNAGDKLSANKASAIISSISISMDPSNGLTSTYQFRTSSKKLGLFNKELSDTYKSFNQQTYRNNLKMSRENFRSLNAAGLISTTPNSTLFSRFRNAQLTAFGVNPAFQAFSRGPINNSNIPANFVMVANNFASPNRHNFQGSFKKPDNVDSINLEGSTSKSYVSIIPDYEAFKLCGSNYDKVSMMSFDGLFSPISLYPTVNNATFHIAKYTRQKCPYCRGNTQQYIHHYVDLDQLSDKDIETIKTTDSNNSSFKKTEEYELNNCPFCIEEEEKKQQITTYSKRNLIDPPYILVSGDDSEYVQNRVEEYRDTPLFINKYTLTPIVLNSGDFGISLARQKGDKTFHNIDIAGFGHLPPDRGMSARGSLSKNLTYNGDAHDKTLEIKNEDQKEVQNNVRFIGLRGPLMVHGWGYDVNGYPIPNSSGEFKTINGQIQYHQGKPLYRNQIVKADGSVTDPYPEHTFAKGWIDTPGTWPVGPVDLRWDPNSCTWISPQGYKRVWVTIENDLVDENPVRGHINSMGEPTDILPEGLRRVVYVSNPLGTTKAPRQSALYCEYNPDNNHYIPLNVGDVSATGKLLSSSTATIYASYAYLEEDQNPLSYSASFVNPLKLETETGKIGIFVFGGEDGWIIQNIED